MKTNNHTNNKRLWPLLLTIFVGIILIALFITSNSCQIISGGKSSINDKFYSCPSANYSDPLIIILIGWLAIITLIIKLTDLFQYRSKLRLLINLAAIFSIIYLLCRQQFWLTYAVTLVVNLLDIWLDKLSTKTSPRPISNKLILSKIESVRSYNSDMIVAIVASVAKPSGQKEFLLVSQYADKHHIKPAPATSIRKAPSSGMYATIERRRLIIGDYNFMLKNKIQNMPDDYMGQTTIFVAVNGKYIGAIHFDTQLDKL